MDEKVKHIIELSKLVCKMECDDIYEFKLLREYRNKYYDERA